MSEPQRFQPVPPPRRPPTTPPVEQPPAQTPPPLVGPFRSPPGGFAAQTPAPYAPTSPPGGQAAQMPAPYTPPPFGPPLPFGAPPAPSPATAKPSNNIGWAIASIFFFWPLAVPAFIFSGQVNGSWNRGDRAAALDAARKARLFGMLGVGLGVVLGLIVAVLG